MKESSTGEESERIELRCSGEVIFCCLWTVDIRVTFQMDCAHQTQPKKENERVSPIQ